MPRLYDNFKDIIKFEEEEFYTKWRKAIPKFHKMFTDGELTFEEQREKRVREAFGDQHLSDSIVREVILKTFDKDFVDGWQPFSDTIEILEYLKDIRKGIITNGSIKQQNEKIDKLGIRDYFDCILISEEVGISKPDVRLFQRACEELNCQPNECFFVGDSWESDVIGSHNSGMNPIWFNRYDKEIPKQFENLVVIHGLSEIKRFRRK